MGGNSPDRAAIACGDEKLRSTVPEEGIPARIDQFELLAAQLRNRMLQPRGKAPAKINESFAAALVADPFDNYFCIRHFG